MWTRRRLAVTAEAADERVRIGIACVAECGCIGALIAAEIEAPGPVSSRSLAIPYPLNIDSRLISVVIPSEREVIGDGREDVIVAYLAPAIEPVDVGHGRLRQASPIGRARDGPELVVAGEELGRRVIQCAPGQAVNLAVGWDKPFGVVAQTERNLVDYGRAEQAHPVEGYAVILVQVV